MANALFDKGREGILNRTIDMTGDVRACLVAAGYMVDLADHATMADIGANDNGRSEALTSKSYSAGVFGAADTSLTARSAVECDALVIFQHTGNDATARLIAYIDDPKQGLPFTPAAGQIVRIEWSTGPNRIFKL